MMAHLATNAGEIRRGETTWPFGLLFSAVSDMGPKWAIPLAVGWRLSTIGGCC